MSDRLFPSGPWTGFYNYQPKDKHRMDLVLAFASGLIHGEGNDDVGRFSLQGRYDPMPCECDWTKSYVGGHQVRYRGFREGKGIWGVWEIDELHRGGFHIWPCGLTVGESDANAAEQKTPVKPPLLLPAPRQRRLRRARRSLQ